MNTPSPIFLTHKLHKKRQIYSNTPRSRLIALCRVSFTESKSGTEILYRFSCSKFQKAYYSNP